MSTIGLPSSETASLSKSWKYLAQERLPRIDAATTFREVYSQLNRSGTSGFILHAKGGEVLGYVKASELAKEVVDRANSNSQTLREYSSQPIGQIVTEFSMPLVPVKLVETGTTEAVLHSAGETVFQLEGPGGSAAGWYLNHESVRETATKKTVFICTNGHRNPDSDHGTCYRCPFPIISTDTE